MAARRAFTLIESMVALAIAGIILSAGVSAVMSMNSHVAEVRRRTEAWDEAQRLEEYLVARTQAVGGGALRAQNAVLVEDNCGLLTGLGAAGLPDCLQSDRITFLEPVPSTEECRVLSEAGGTLTVGLVGATCCLDLPAPTSWNGRQAVLVGDDGSARSIALTTASGCTIGTVPGQAAPLMPGPLAGVVPGTLVQVLPTTIFLDRAGSALTQWRDKNRDGAASAGELIPIHLGVDDLQIALGYDGAPEDGEVTNTSGTNDEWLYNDAGDTAIGAPGFLAGVAPDQLRMVEFGLVMAVVAPSTVPTSVLNGPVRFRPGMYLATARARAYLRNLGLFTPMTTRSPRGYSLPMVVVLCALIAASGLVALGAIEASVKATDFALGRRKGFYVCDGVARTLAVASRPYLNSTTSPTTPGLMTAVCGSAALPCATGAALVPSAGFTIEEMDVEVAGTPFNRIIPTGPFRLMNARQMPIEISVKLTKDADHDGCLVSQRMLLAEIGLFQFFVFSDGYMDLFNGPPMDIDGRVHVNGDFCAHAGGASPPVIGQLTASGRVLASCTRADSGGGTNFFVRDSTGTPKEINPGCDSGCVNCSASCPGDSGPWRSFAMSRWDGRLLDVEQGVPPLRLPVSGSPPVQDGLDASGAGKDNSGSLRLVLDPPQAAEDPSVSAQRYAFKAGIRIIDGVWYRNDGTWPGVPIWSDHPGSYAPTAPSDEAAVLHGTPSVGQGDLVCPGAAPRRFSYYAHDCTGALLPFPATPAVVSYGLVTTGPNRRPARYPFAAAATSADVLMGTRSGFIDHRVKAGATNGEEKILPMNFDVAAFAQALQDPTAGELGSVVTPATFNGIVYIYNSWPGSNGSMGGPGVQAPPLLPPRVDTPSQAGIPGGPAEATAALPRNLCSTSGPALGDGYTAPSCSNEAEVTRPNAVRIINGQTLDPVAFPKGLSIVTNGPMYILGEYNTASAVANGAPPPAFVPAPPGTWVGAMVGADAVTLLSSAWSDANAKWGAAVSAAQLTGRAPVDSSYVLSILSGNVETSNAAWGGGINNFPRFLEDWNSNTTVIYGSLVNGFRSVFQRQPYRVPGPSGGPEFVYRAPDRTWLYDTNLDNPANQPPGTPKFSIQSIDRFRRD